MKPRRMTRRSFDLLVSRALRTLPQEFKKYLKYVSVVVENRPSYQDIEGDSSDLYGYYEGVPLTEQTPNEPHFPPRITIFREPLLRDFGSNGAEIVRQIRLTVLHEIGHHFGLEESDLEKYED